MGVSTGKYLFVDNFIVEDAWNLKRQTMRPAKHIDNPLLVPDQPWEQTAMGGCYVLFDEQENIFKMWYHVFSYVAWKSNEENWYTYWTCYAESPDGIAWNKPDLGIVEFEGSTRNNIILQGQWWAVPGTVLKENYEPDPAKRYKLLYTDVSGVSREDVARDGGITGEWPGRSGVCIAYSADGIHWEPYIGNPVIDGESDTSNIIFWDESIKKYVYYMRPPLYAGPWKRRIARAESKDLLQWSAPETVLIPDELDPLELYGMPVFQYEGYYFGLLQVYHSATTETIDIQLAFSRDGKNWDRLPQRDTFLGLGLRHGQGKDFDAGMVIVDKPVFIGDEIRFYYTGYNRPHNDTQGKTAMGLATSRMDRLIGRATWPGERGVLLTRPLTCEGNQLEINTASTDGAIQVEVLTEAGEIIAGYERSSCPAVSDDSLRHRMTWLAGRDLSSLRGQRIRFKFYLSNAVLYSFQVTHGTE
jgi:hypothetical protein